MTSRNVRKRTGNARTCFGGAMVAAEPFERKMKGLIVTLREQQFEASRRDAVITANLKELGYGG
ncbi:MAG: hypothetical protein KKA32_10090 [Actinobacteria bacterium]|nr:hypothetical protein [Actinomycetota bacterium]